MSGDKARLGVIFVMLLFFGSSIGAGLFLLPSNSVEDVEFPSTIVVSNLDSRVEEAILSMGGSIIYFTYSDDCEQCYVLLDKIKEAVSGLQPYVYVVYGEGDSTSIVVVNALGSETLTSASLKTLVEMVCETIPPGTPQFNKCLDLAVVVPNESISA